MDIKVLPFLARSECVTLEALLGFLLLDHSLGDRFVHVLLQILFGQADYDGRLGDDLTDLIRPSGHVVTGWHRIDSDADNEHVSMRVLHLSVLAQVLIAARIMDLDVDLLFLDVLDASIDVEHGGLVLLREVVLQIVANQAGLTNGRIANQYDFDGFGPVCRDLSTILSYPRDVLTWLSTGFIWLGLFIVVEVLAVTTCII